MDVYGTGSSYCNVQSAIINIAIIEHRRLSTLYLFTVQMDVNGTGSSYCNVQYAIIHIMIIIEHWRLSTLYLFTYVSKL